MRYFWDAARELDPARASWTRVNASPTSRREASGGLFDGAGLADVRVRARSTSRRSSATSTTTGTRSSRARVRRRRTAPRSTTVSRPNCASCSASGSRARLTARSVSPHAPGRCRVGARRHLPVRGGLAFLQVAQDLPGRVGTGSARDAATGMRTGARQVQPVEHEPIPGLTVQRPPHEELISPGSA